MTQYNDMYRTTQSNNESNESLPIGEQIIIVVASLFLTASGFGLGVVFANM